jgi:hypothetical protein
MKTVFIVDIHPISERLAYTSELSSFGSLEAAQPKSPLEGTTSGALTCP